MCDTKVKSIDWTKPVQTKSGQLVELISTSGREPYPIIGYLADSTMLFTWTREGIFNLTARGHDLSLIQVPTKRVLDIWINVYPDGGIYTYDTKELADVDAFTTRIACIHITREYTEGEGL